MTERSGKGGGRRGRSGLWGGLVFAALVALSCWAPGPVGGQGSTSNVTFTTSTTHHTTYTRKDLPDLQAFQTTILGLFSGPPPAFVYSQAFSAPFADPAVQAGILAAKAAITAAAAPQPVTIVSPTLVASSTSANTAFLGNQLNHTDQTVTTTASLGPGTILIGDDQSQTFFVQAGTTNYNTNTHTETFMDQVYQKTNTLSQTYELDGAAAIPTLSEWALIGMAGLLVAGGLAALRRRP